MKNNKLAISVFLGTSLMSSQALGASIVLGPGTVISGRNIEMNAPDIEIDPSARIDANNLTINGENYSAEEFNKIVERVDFEKIMQNQYHLNENDLQELDKYALEFLKSNPEIEELYKECEQVSRDTSLTEDEKDIKVRSISQQIFANDTYSQFRVHPTNQEILKLRLKRVEHARELSKDNKRIDAFAEEELQDLKNDLEEYLVTDFTNKKAKDLPEVQKSDSSVTESLINSSMVTRDVIDSRMGDVTGISSGDDYGNTYGVWARGMFSQGSQKAVKNSAGYKFDQKGFTVGADIGDESMVGIAYSYLKGTVKDKGTKSNKSDADTHAISLYGRYAITDEIFASGQTQLGFSKIKKKRATGDIANNIAAAKPKGKTMAGKIELGYDFSYDPAIHIIPTLGFSYTNAEVNGYTERGDGLNRSVGKRKSSRSSGIANVAAKYILTTGSTQIIPELRVGVDYAFDSKNSGTKVKIINGIEPIVTPSEKLTKAFYIVGAGVQAIQSDNYEFSAGYDMGFAKKFQSHTGTLKLRVKF